MPPQSDEDRIDRLEKRVDKIEDSIDENLAKIFQALEELKVSGVKNACPAPGACVGLSSELQHAITAHNATMLRVERLELRILDAEKLAIQESRKVEREFAKLEKQKAWVLGAWSVIALCAAIVGTLITLLTTYLLNKL